MKPKLTVINYISHIPIGMQIGREGRLEDKLPQNPCIICKDCEGYSTKCKQYNDYYIKYQETKGHSKR